MNSIKYKFLFVVVLVVCLLTIISAYLIEYVLGHTPCNLCLFERIPYFATIILASLVLLIKKCEKITMIIIGIFFVCGAVISFYHFGIEQGFFSESLVCDIGINNKSTSPQDLLKELNLKAVSCKDVTFRFLGLSLATLNTILSLIICVIMLRLGIKYDKNK